jgi:hypothetical protein
MTPQRFYLLKVPYDGQTASFSDVHNDEIRGSDTALTLDDGGTSQTSLPALDPCKRLVH